MRRNFEKMKFSKIKFLLIKMINIIELCLTLLINAETLCMNYFLCMNSISGLCLCLRDTAVNLTFHLNSVRWLVEGKGVEVVHEALVRHH